ncbi:uncharacterized protein BDCG_17546, partial [Blastomyces dermatitidis ER-3]
SSCVDRSAFINDSELNIESLIKNLKNVIMKKLFILYVTESSVSLSALSISFSVTLSHSSTPVSVSGSSPATSVPVILTSTTSGFTVSAFIISSSHFKKMLYRLNESSLSVFALASEAILIKDDNTVKTTLSHSQASIITFSPSPFSVRKVVHTL